MCLTLKFISQYQHLTAFCSNGLWPGCAMIKTATSFSCCFCHYKWCNHSQNTNTLSVGKCVMQRNLGSHGCTLITGGGSPHENAFRRFQPWRDLWCKPCGGTTTARDVFFWSGWPLTYLVLSWYRSSVSFLGFVFYLSFTVLRNDIMISSHIMSPGHSSNQIPMVQSLIFGISGSLTFKVQNSGWSFWTSLDPAHGLLGARQALAKHESRDLAQFQAEPEDSLEIRDSLIQINIVYDIYIYISFYGIIIYTYIYDYKIYYNMYTDNIGTTMNNLSTKPSVPLVWYTFWIQALSVPVCWRPRAVDGLVNSTEKLQHGRCRNQQLNLIGD